MARVGRALAEERPGIEWLGWLEKAREWRASVGTMPWGGLDAPWGACLRIVDMGGGAGQPAKACNLQPARHGGHAYRRMESGSWA